MSTDFLHIHQFKAMGSPCQCELVTSSAEPPDFSPFVAEVARLESKYSRFLTDSVTSELRQCAELGGNTAVDEETAALFNLAEQAYALSGGLFDITSCSLSEIWDFKKRVVPSSEQIAQKLALTGWEQLGWSSPSISFVEGMAIDFGGLVKEYAVDCLITIAQQQGFRSALFDLGGDIACFGAPPGESAWRVGVRNPNGNDALCSLTLRKGAIASSGIYERRFEMDGKIYSHLINPKTGWPANEVVSVTVVSQLCVMAGILSTSAMLMPSAQAVLWLEQLGVRYVVVDSQDRVFKSS